MVEVVTALVLTVKVALLVPAETGTLAGTLATAVLLLVRPTEIPPAGAGPLKVTVPVELPPPRTLVGLRVSALTPGGVTVRVAPLLVLL